MEKQLKLFFEFLENDKKLSDNTLQSYKRDIKQFKEYLNQKGKDYSNITKEDMKEYIEHLQSIGKKLQQYQDVLHQLDLFINMN